MGSQDTWIDLMLLNESKALAVISDSLDKYYSLLTDIGADIYDSCIKDFYSKYTPSSYKRHGNLAGENLYRANKISYDGYTTNFILDEYSLLPYGKHDKRDEVLDYVTRGLRGGKLKNSPEFPMKWYTSYPNSYSRYRGVWQSSQIILGDILREFVKTGIRDTIHIAADMIRKKI